MSRSRRMKASDLIHLYRARLRSRSAVVQDIFAIAGIAVGVALLFASQVDSTSLSRSVQKLSSQLVGNSEYQLDSRGPAGVDERVLAETRAIHGVEAALPVLEQQAQVIGPNGQERSVDLIGTDPQFAHFGGPLLKRFSAAQLAAQQVIALPAPIAGAIGAGAFQTIQIRIGAQVVPTLLGAKLAESDIGGLVHSPVALAPVGYAQSLTGMAGRITRIFIQSQHGSERAVAAGLAHLAAAEHLNLEPANFDVQLFNVAALPQNQSETLFSAISALVGFALALNAMLITVPRRRRLLTHFRGQGANHSMARQILLFDAMVLGVIACFLGLGLGDLLSILVFHATPGYLSFAFPVGNQRIITWQCVAIAVLAGMTAAVAGVLWPLRDVFSRPRTSQSLNAHWWGLGRAIAGVTGMAITTVILFARPQDAKLGNLTLVVALLCALPGLFHWAIVLFAKLQPVLNRPSAQITLTQIRIPATRVRALAIVATSAIATFGVVAIQGAKSNLLRGLDISAHDIDSGADVWVTTRGESNAFATTAFTYRKTAALAGIPGVRDISEYRGGFLTWGDRRLWVLAPPAGSAAPIPASELVTGDLARADARMREGGWVVLSKALAAEHGLRVGAAFMMPSPHPQTFHVAALSTNLGWPPGAMVMNASDYASAWASSAPSALEIHTDPGARPETVRHLIQTALGPNTGLIAETAAQREQRHYSLASQGLLRLAQIRLLVLIAAMLAIGGALGSLIWQRRDYVARIRALGARKQVLRRWLLWESLLLLSVGCSMGAIFGVYGQLLMSHALSSVTGFPITFEVEILAAITTFALICIGAVAAIAVPGYLMLRVRPRAVRQSS
jgi:putative ABC transport system permease protein